MMTDKDFLFFLFFSSFFLNKKILETLKQVPLNKQKISDAIWIKYFIKYTCPHCTLFSIYEMT